MPMQISGVTIQGGMNILPRAGAPSPSPTPGPSDPDFSNVVFMFDGDGTDGGANNTFTDSSTNGFTVTENGSVLQGSFSPYGDNWSNYFDGASNADLVIADSDNLSAEDQDFTLEAWVYVENAGGSNKAIWSKWGGGTQEILFGISSNNLVAYISTYGVATPLLTSSTSVGSGWNHVALTRNGNDFDLWLNGVNTASATQAGSIQNQTADVTIGDYVDGGWQYYGYISNLRWVKGTAIYTSAFTPSAAPLTAITNTQLLTCQSNRFVDGSTNKHSVAINNTVKVTPFSPFTNSDARTLITDGGSAYFDGTAGNYLDIPHNAVLEPTGDFTIEFWAYVTYRSGTQEWYSKGYGIQIYLSGDKWSVALFATGQGYYVNALTEFVTENAWTHVALTRSGNDYRFFINGSLATSVNSTYAPDTATDVLRIGEWSGGSGYLSYGYMSDVRYLNGTAVYTSAFTPPTAPLTAVTNTETLLNFQDSAIYDYSGINNIDTIGAQITTAVKKFGTGSVEFNGTSDYLNIPYKSQWDLSSGDFTIEAWAYADALGSWNSIVGQWPQQGGSNSNSFVLETVGSEMRFYVGRGTDISFNSLGAISTGSWDHWAVTREGNTLRGFKNGTLVFTNASFSDINSAQPDITVGGNVAGAGYWDGYIDDLRITKGVARYTSNFTPPTAALPKF